MGPVLLKQYWRLVNNIDNFTAGQVQISNQHFISCCQDSLDYISLSFSPKGGPYRGGKFDFTINLKHYPFIPPDVVCHTLMYHPNIGVDGIVCLNILFELWTPSVTLEDIVQGVLFLFYNPNLKDPINGMFYGTESYNCYKCNVRKSLKGGCVANTWFERNLPEDFEESEDEEDSDDHSWIENNDQEENEQFYNTEDELESEDSESYYPSDIDYDEIEAYRQESILNIRNRAAELVIIEVPEETVNGSRRLSTRIRRFSFVAENNLRNALVGMGTIFAFFLPRALCDYAVLIYRRVYSILMSLRTMWTN